MNYLITVHWKQLFLKINHIIKILYKCIIEFADIIKSLVGGKSEVIITAAVEDDPQRRKPDITRAMTYLNWKPKVNLIENN